MYIKYSVLNLFAWGKIEFVLKVCRSPKGEIFFFEIRVKHTSKWDIEYRVALFRYFHIAPNKFHLSFLYQFSVLMFSNQRWAKVFCRYEGRKVYAFIFVDLFLEFIFDWLALCRDSVYILINSKGDRYFVIICNNVENICMVILVSFLNLLILTLERKWNVNRLTLRLYYNTI